MPMPIVVLKLHARLGRDPEPHDLTEAERRDCLRCAQESSNADVVARLQRMGGLGTPLNPLESYS